MPSGTVTSATKAELLVHALGLDAEDAGDEADDDGADEAGAEDTAEVDDAEDGGTGTVGGCVCAVCVDTLSETATGSLIAPAALNARTITV